MNEQEPETNQYSLEEAENEAAALKKKIEKGKAGDYAEAEEKMEAGYQGPIHKMLKEIKRFDERGDDISERIMKIAEDEKLPISQFQNNNLLLRAARDRMDTDIKTSSASAEGLLKLKNTLGISDEFFKNIVIGALAQNYRTDDYGKRLLETLNLSDLREEIDKVRKDIEDNSQIR